MNGAERKKLQGILEAILFTMGGSVELVQLVKATGYEEDEIRQVLKDMMEQYKKKEHGIQIIELEDSYQMCTKKEMYEYLIQVAKQPKKHILTDVLLETLSIIAYKQPITKIEIEKIRGVKTDHAVNKLVEYELVEEVGRLDAIGRPILFGTTEEFLRRFHVQSLEELPMPKPEEVENFKEEAKEEAKVKLNI